MRKTRPARSTFTIAVRLPKANGSLVLARTARASTFISTTSGVRKRVF
ncbi:hypothetical protein ACVXG7_32220 [Enterobacter hormaechei]